MWLPKYGSTWPFVKPNLFPTFTVIVSYYTSFASVVINSLYLISLPYLSEQLCVVGSGGHIILSVISLEVQQQHVHMHVACDCHPSSQIHVSTGKLTRPATPILYLAAVEKNWEMHFFPPRLQDAIWVWECRVTPSTSVLDGPYLWSYELCIQGVHIAL